MPFSNLKVGPPNDSSFYTSEIIRWHIVLQLKQFCRNIAYTSYFIHQFYL